MLASSTACLTQLALALLNSLDHVSGWHCLRHESWARLWAGCTGEFVSLDKIRNWFTQWKTIPNIGFRVTLPIGLPLEPSPGSKATVGLLGQVFLESHPPSQATAGKGGTAGLGAGAGWAWLGQGAVLGR